MHYIVYSKELYCLDHLEMMRPTMIQVRTLEILVQESTIVAAAAAATEAV